MRTLLAALGLRPDARLIPFVISTFMALSLAAPNAGAQESCANLQYQLGVLRSSGGAGSQWDTFIVQRMQQLGCFGQRRPVQYGDRCSNGGVCPVGTHCAQMPGKCIPNGAADCGSYYCTGGQKCGIGSTHHCVPQNAVDCGNGGFCNAGQKCVANHRCVAENAVACGQSYCNPGLVCGPGNRCMTQAISNALLARQRYRQQYGECVKQYNIESCRTAIKSPSASAVDAIMMAAAEAYVVAFNHQFSACKNGSALDCDRALASPTPMASHYHLEIVNARASASPLAKAWAAIVPVGLSISRPIENAWSAISNPSATIHRPAANTIPTSTLLVGALALILGVILAVVLFQTKTPAPQTGAEPHAVSESPKAPEPQTAPEVKSAPDETPKPPAAPPAAVENTAVTKTQSPSPQTAYLLNLLLPGAGNIYFGQPVIGAVFILSILFGLFMFVFGASAAFLGLIIIIVSIVAAFFTLGLSLIIGIPIGGLFLLMGAGPILAFFIWLFSLVISELLVRSKAQKMAAPAPAVQ